MPGSKEDREGWGQAAQSYDAEYRSMVGEAFENEIRSWLARQVTDADKVLELGCGTGIFSAMIAEHVKHLTATDSSPEMLEQATHRLGGCPNAELRMEDAYHTSFADGSFSAVLTVNLLHHVDAPGNIVRECRRVLTPGGKLVVIECAGHGTSFWSWIKTGLAYLRPSGRVSEDHHHLSSDDLAALITNAGLAVQETELLWQRRPRMGFICLRAMNAG